MKKFILSLVLLLGIIGLCSCGNKEVTVNSIEVSGQKTEFKVGESFDDGALKVVASLSDGSTVDVTKDVEVKPTATELSNPGSYAVIVSYKGLSYVYQINVTRDAPDNFASVAEAVAAAIANANQVNEGTAEFTEYGHTTTHEYKFGNGYFADKITSGDFVEEYHYEFAEDGSASGVLVSTDWEGNPSLSAIIEPSAELAKGFDMRSLFNYEYELYGVEASFETIYALASSENAKNFKEEISVCPACGSHYRYTFSSEVVFLGSYYYVIEASFDLSPNNSLKTAEIVMDIYYDDAKVVRDKIPAVDENGEPILDEEGNPTYVAGDVIGLQEDVEYPDYSRSLSVAQSEGERNAVNEYSMSKFAYNSFDVVDEEGNNVDGQVIEMSMGSSLVLNIANPNPDTANSSIDEIRVDITDENGESTWYVYGSCYNGQIEIGAYAMGNYNVVVSSKNVTKSFTLVVSPAQLTEFTAGIYAGYELAPATSANAYPGVELEIGVIVNDNADASFTAEFKNPTENATLTYNEWFGSYIFSSEVQGTYEVVLTSSSNPEFTATLTIEVVTPPSLEELVVGKYEFEDVYSGTWTYEFIPASEGALNGTYTVEFNNIYGPSENYEYNYAIVDGAIVCTSKDGEELGAWDYAFATGPQFNLIATYGDGLEIGALSKVEEQSGAGLVGEFEYIITNPMGFEIPSVIVFNADGTGYYDISGQAGQFSGEFTFVEEDGYVVFSNVTPLYGTEAIEISAFYENDVVYLSYQFGGSYYDAEFTLYVAE